MYPYMILYPGAVLMSATVLKYSDHVPSRVLSGVLLLWCISMPYFTVKVLCRVQAFADYAPTQPESLKERLIDGSNTWDWNGGGKGWAEFRIFHMFFDSYRKRDKSFLVCDLLNTLAIALIQSYRPESEAGCDMQAYMVFIVMVLFALYYTFRVVSISPTEQGMDVLILWAEITVKSLATFVDPGAAVGHWSLTAAGILTLFAFAVVITKTIFATIVLLRDEKDHWMLFKAGGGQTSPGLGRAFDFFMYWVFYNRVPKMLREKGPPPPASTPILEEICPALTAPEGLSSPAQRSLVRERMSFSTSGPAATPPADGNVSMITDIMITQDGQSSRRLPTRSPARGGSFNLPSNRRPAPLGVLELSARGGRPKGRSQLSPRGPSSPTRFAQYNPEDSHRSPNPQRAKLSNPLSETLMPDRTGRGSGFNVTRFKV
eukprot:Hpha_TRINITY_DN16920_c2_g2::TRINITY_DN16920_c2_g2_i3::g.52474::m.52474